MKIDIKCWGGCKINDMYEHLDSTLTKGKYDYLLLHVGTSDSVFRDSESMLIDIIKLKQYIESSGTKVIISNIIDRSDNGKASITIKRFNEKLSKLKIPIMDNSNITSKYLGRKGLHLAARHGTGKLAMNLISLIRGL